MAADMGCAVCGDPVHYHGTVHGVRRNKETGERIRSWPAKNPAWIHSNGVRRDHPATPAVGRTPEADMARQNAMWDQAHSVVKGTLQKQFDYLHAENTVNDLFKDRRGNA